MPRIRTLTLSAAARLTLCEARDHHPAPAVRERAAALLKIADGMPAHQVARRGLLKVRHPATVTGWLTRYQQQGVLGLLQHRQGGARRRGPL